MAREELRKFLKHFQSEKKPKPKNKTNLSLAMKPLVWRSNNTKVCIGGGSMGGTKVGQEQNWNGTLSLYFVYLHGNKSDSQRFGIDLVELIGKEINSTYWLESIGCLECHFLLPFSSSFLF